MNARKAPAAFEWGSRTYLMGIVNVTPDSFSGDGLMASTTEWVDAAVREGQRHARAGADIVDVGGESTRPGAEPLSLKEELGRVIPVIAELSKKIAVPISIDTYKSEVARQAIEAGARIINDVWGLKRDPKIASVAAEYGTPLILMHNRSEERRVERKAGLGARYTDMQYGDLLADIRRELQEAADKATGAGVARERLILDPGIGFGKTVQQNLELLDRLRELRAIGFPILVGPSRKSFVGYTLDLPPEERLEGTAAAVALAIDRGADIVRVHDVKAMHRVARFTDAVVR